MDKRLIEERFPIREVSEASAKEKYIRKGNISTLHLWWARRPLASSRATAYAALIPSSKNVEEWNNKKKFIESLSKWENILNKNIINRATKDISNYFEGVVPKVLDPFSGGGAIPLESMRLGCDTYASDYNPVAVLIEKCVLQYPQEFGDNLVNEVQKWGNFILDEVLNELEDIYPKTIEYNKGYFADSSITKIDLGYLWSKTVICQNPECEAEIPLMRSFWLAKKKDKKICLYPYVEKKKINFKILGTGYGDIPEGFNPNNGTISRGIAQCLVCGSMLDIKNIRNQFNIKKANQKMIAVVSIVDGKKGKTYRVANIEDVENYKKSGIILKKKIKELKEKWTFEPIPNEELPPIGTLGFRVQRYGILQWGEMFNSRQKLTLLLFAEKVREVYNKINELDFNKNQSKIITTYLALVLDRLVVFCSKNCTWKVDSTQIVNTFVGRNALQMTWDYFELNPISGASTSWQNAIKVVLGGLTVTKNLSGKIKKVIQSSATDLPFSDNFFDAVFTDPPYYDNIPYSYLSDFFYVWLKRTIGFLYPDLFSTPLTPKSKEIVAYSHEKSWTEAKEYFEDMIFKAFQEIHRTLKPNGILILVYAHKTTEGWETIINALLKSKLTVTASWPLSTEMKARLRSKESASLTSSIYIIARKIKKVENGFFSEVKRNLKNYLEDKLERLWQEGISGPDFFISAIGAGIEIFGAYNRIIDYEGNLIQAETLLKEIRSIVTDFAIKQILHNGFSKEISTLTRFYLLWRWNFQESKVIFDEAKKLAQSVGINLDREWNKGFIEKSGSYIRILGPKDRKMENIEDSEELIDILQYILLLWEKGKIKEIITKLSSKFGESEIFYRVAQAISQTLPNNSKEKKLLEGFLLSKNKLKDDIRMIKSQKKIEGWTK